ncbi:hypothetical protein ACWGI8_25455 [Streptomyces sp. NPDC054841]
MKFAAVLVAVVLALTGFSTSSSSGKGGGKSKGSRSSSGGGGGGCSSSKKSNGGYHDYDSDSDYDSGSGSDSSSGADSSATAEPTPEASTTDGVEVVIVECVAEQQRRRKSRTGAKATSKNDKPAATLRLTSRDSSAHTVDVDVDFVTQSGLYGKLLDSGTVEVTLKAGESRTVEVPMRTPKEASRVGECLISDVSVEF